MTVPVQPKGRVLVVDDDEWVCRLLDMLLTDSGYAVQTAGGFDEACSWMGRDAFDLVTLDIVMPGVTGLDALRWLRQHYPDVGVIMSTGLGDMDLVIEAMRLGAYSYMIKPLKVDLVVHEVGRAMERQRLVLENRSYQQHLEQRVVEQTQELRTAHDQLAQQVRELEARDQLVRCQLDGPNWVQACETVMRVLWQVLAVPGAALFVGGDEPPSLAAVLDAEGAVRIGGLETDAAAWDGPAALAVEVHRSRQGQSVPGRGTALPLMYQDEILAVLWVTGLDADDQKGARNLLWRLGQASAPVLWAARIQEDLDSGRLQVDELLGLE